MFKPLRLVLVAGLALLTAGAAQAIEFRSVSEPAILFDSPSTKGKPLFIIATGTPVEVVVVLDKWIKVRDAGGGLSWIEARQLADKRTVMVSAERATAHSSPDEGSPTAFQAARDVVLELSGTPTNGWVAVRHRDGASGFLRVTDVWGL